MTRLLASLSALALALLPACSSTGPGREPDPSWQTATFDVASGTVLWEYAVLAVEKLGFHLGSGLDPANMRLETGWKTSLVPFRGEGFRQKAVIAMAPHEEGGWDVRVRVMRQTNESLVRPADPRYAEWKWSADDVGAASVLLQHVRTYVRPAGAGG